MILSVNLVIWGRKFVAIENVLQYDPMVIQYDDLSKTETKRWR